MELKEIKNTLFSCDSQEEFIGFLKEFREQIYEAVRNLDSSEDIWLVGVKGILDDLYKEEHMKKKIVCILSDESNVGGDGVYLRRELKGEEREEALESLQQVPYYISHPDMKKIVEVMGAIPATNRSFPGLKPGETALIFPRGYFYKLRSIITQGSYGERDLGVIVHRAIEGMEKLNIVAVTMLSDNPTYHCPTCANSLAELCR